MKNQHHKIIQLIVAFVLLISCNGQNKENNKPIHKTVVIKELDKSYLDTIQAMDKKDKKIQLIENDTIVELKDQGHNYLETRRKKNDTIYNHFAYDKNNHLMISSGTSFYRIPIGIFRRYNEKGEIVEEINRDENFPFSVYDLIKKIKATHHMDLNEGKKDRFINREFDEETDRYIYLIQYNISQYDGSYKYIKVDGATGEILSEGNDYFL